MILVAIGANLPGLQGEPALATCEAALRALRDLPGLTMAAVSPWYLTDPVPPSGQPPYVNGMARLEGAVTPAALLAELLSIETRFGRSRGAPNGPRILDLDLIAMGDMVRDFPDPILPHPRAHLRGFVLAPLVDVAPGWIHPRFARTAAHMLAELPGEGRTLL